MKQKERPLSSFFMFVVIFLIVFFLLDFYLSNRLFCSSCDFNDKNILFKLFYRNDSDSGYHSEPTFFNILVLLSLSFIGSWLIVRNRN
jgi:hypothetical protein